MAPIQRAPHEVNRLLSRLITEYTVAGWSSWTLGRACDVHPSVLRRWENGEVKNPLLSIVVAVSDYLGLRLDFVAQRHLPLLPLDEFEIEALIEGALVGWREVESGSPTERHLTSALTKLGKLTTTREASEHV